MAKTRPSAGLLPYRITQGAIEVFLVHPGGPFWAKKDAGAWSIAKGELGDEEDALTAAGREFQEETGIQLAGPFIPLDPVRQPGGKVVHAWAVQADLDPAQVRSNTFSIEWPPHSGRQQQFPEIDRAAWFDVNTAKSKILKGQLPLIEQLAAAVASPDRERRVRP
jgi:predicted NUDIX family NTP pyrophosphohydrolase